MKLIQKIIHGDDNRPPRNIEIIITELAGLGYTPVIKSLAARPVVIINYAIKTGRYAGKEIALGLAFQEELYPEYPPHWIYLPVRALPEDWAGELKYTDEAGQTWVMLSRPPLDIWDGLPTKDMRAYMTFHLARFFRELK